jgi:hypothetical protein
MLRVVSCGISVISFYKFNTKYCLVCINNIIIIKINIKIEIDNIIICTNIGNIKNRINVLTLLNITRRKGYQHYFRFRCTFCCRKYSESSNFSYIFHIKLHISQKKFPKTNLCTILMKSMVVLFLG